MNKKIIKPNVSKLAQFENQYVAFTLNRSQVLASGATIKELEKKLKTLHIIDAIVSYVPSLSKYIAPICQ